MSTILLQLEAALADARGAQEKAAEALHDTGVKHALAKSQYDAATDTVKRVEGALNSMHGVAQPTSALAEVKKLEPPAKPPRKREEGQACPSCGARGTLAVSMIGTAKFAICGECNAQHQAA